MRNKNLDYKEFCLGDMTQIEMDQLLLYKNSEVSYLISE